MDQFGIELHRSLYKETIGSKRRREASLGNFVEQTEIQKDVPFLIARLNLKALSYVMLLAMSFAALALIVISFRAINFLNTEINEHSQKVQKQISFAKDLEILAREILALEREQFASEIEKNQQSFNEQIVSKSQLFQQKAGSLEHMMGDRPAIVFLTSLQVSFADWKLLHEEWSQKFSSGNPDLTYALYDEAIGELRSRLYANAYGLSSAMEDLARFELAEIEQGLDFFSFRMKIASGFVLFVIAVFLWSMIVCLSGLADFFEWMKIQCCDLHFGARKIDQLSFAGERPLERNARIEDVRNQTEQIIKALDGISEVFAGEWKKDKEWKFEAQASYRESKVSQAILQFEERYFKEASPEATNIVPLKAKESEAEEAKNSEVADAKAEGAGTQPEKSEELPQKKAVGE